MQICSISYKVFHGLIYDYYSVLFLSLLTIDNSSLLMQLPSASKPVDSWKEAFRVSKDSFLSADFYSFKGWVVSPTGTFIGMLDPRSVNVLAYELENRSLGLVILETCLFVIFTLAALAGNSCVLYVFYKSPDLRTVTNYYLMALAISDFVYPAITMPPIIATSATGRDMYGETGKAIGFIGLSCAIGSILTTSLIAKNRFFCVVKPKLYKKFFKKKPAIFMILLAWSTAVFGNVLLSSSGEVTFAFHPGRMIYFPTSQDLSMARLITVLSHIFFVILPLSMTGICYWKVYKNVKVHNASMAANNHGLSSDRSALTKSEIHVTKSLLALVCGSIICWIPPAIIDQISLYLSLPRPVHMLMIYAGSSSSAINPVIFYVSNRPFRKRFRQLIGHCFPAISTVSASDDSQGERRQLLLKVQFIYQQRNHL